MQWLKVTVLTTTEGAEIVSNQLVEAGAGGTMIEDKLDVSLHQRPEGQWDIIDENILLNMSDEVRVTAYYPADARLHDVLSDIRGRLSGLQALDLPFDIAPLSLLTESIDEEDWAEYWKKQFTPIRLGRHIVIRPSWSDFEREPGDIVIEIDPGMAFGTGTHETTGLCAILVEEFLKPGDRVIDIGTGTGILAIAAAALGASEVLAVDIDSVAVRVAGENVKINGFQKNIRVMEGNLFDSVDEIADVVLMNIIADVIIKMAKHVPAHVKPGGTFICSGISVNRLPEVQQALKDAGFHSQDARILGEWAAVACKNA